MQYGQCRLAGVSAPHGHSGIQADSCIIPLYLLHLEHIHWSGSTTWPYITTLGLISMGTWIGCLVNTNASVTGTKEALSMSYRTWDLTNHRSFREPSPWDQAISGTQDWTCILPNSRVTGHGRKLRNNHKTQVISVTPVSTYWTVIIIANIDHY
jgi:hypothetical protein